MEKIVDLRVEFVWKCIWLIDLECNFLCNCPGLPFQSSCGCVKPKLTLYKLAVILVIC